MEVFQAAASLIVKSAATAKQEKQPPRVIMARYPNHVWSVDRTRVLRWGIWPTWVLVGVDHYSRMVTTTRPLEGPNAGWVTTALESAFARYGAPKHIITDQDRFSRAVRSRSW